MDRILFAMPLLLAVTMTLLAGCAATGSNSSAPPLSADNLNLIFVASPDLAHHADGDVQPDTANLTRQGLQRSLLMATYLQQQVLGMNNVTAIYALAPMTHPQTARQYPDMASLGYIQQFALLNQATQPVDLTDSPTGLYTANSHPINASYATGAAPNGVFPPLSICPNCVGLDFNNTHGDNDTLVSGLINAPPAQWAGYHVFSAPWETINALMTHLNANQGYGLDIPASYTGPNTVYAISIAPSGGARLATYNSNLNPPATYPVLPAPVASATCDNSQQPYFKSVRTGGVDGASVPANINTNQKVYIVRHADAHPDNEFEFEDGNFVGAGQWRSLSLANALRGKIRPNMVYSIDPAQWYNVLGPINVSYVRPSLTILPYAIDNNLPYFLASTFPLEVKPDDPATDPVVAKATVDFFFTKGSSANQDLSNQTVLLAWESGHIHPFLNDLIARYGGNPTLLNTVGPPRGGWPSTDYDTIWTVTLDAQGNLTVDNALCEGIDSGSLPAKKAPQF